MTPKTVKIFGFFLLLAIAAGVGLAIIMSPEAKPITEDSQTERSETTSGQFSNLPVLGTIPEFELTDQAGDSFGSEDVANKVWIANFIFTTCTGTCPAQTTHMSELQERLARDPSWDGIRLVTFTVDPSHDTPEVLTDYSEIYGADQDHWKFLTGEREAIWKLCKNGFKMQVSPNPDDTSMPILHDTKMVLIDRMGQIRGYYDSFKEQDRRQILSDIGHVLPEFSPRSPLRTDFPEDITHMAQPPGILDLEWLDDLAKEQEQRLSGTEVFHDFQYKDAIESTGITFSPQIVDEQRWRLQVNHYDHGNGICVADVDGDGHYDVYFLSQAGSNELWRNRGDGTFEDITEKSGTSLKDRISVTASFVDIENDGDVDLYVTTVRDGNALFLNDGKGRFEEVTAASGLQYSGHSSAPVFFDYDRDGFLDLYLCNVGRYTTDELVEVREDLTTNEKAAGAKYYTGIKDAFGGHLKSQYVEHSRLYHNLGDARFEDVTKEMGVLNDKWSGDATPLDGNGDGWTDLYVLNMQGLDIYYENQQGKRFVDKTSEFFPKTSWGAMGVKSFDLENDGDYDLLVTDMHSDMSEDIGPEREHLKSRMEWPESFLASNSRGIYGNSLFRHQDDHQFEEISDRFGAENYWPWGVSAGDLNADGYQDVFVASSMCFPYRYGVNSLWLNESGKQFLSAEFATEIEPRRPDNLLKPWFELDCEGLDSENPICRGRSGKIIVWSCRGTRSSVLFDLDEDGDLDILTNEFNSRPMALISNLTEKKKIHWLKLKLQGRESNRNGLGATVKVSLSSGQVLSQTHDGKSGYLSQSDLPLYFGLGENEAIQAIDVLWPSGKEQHLEGPIRSNQMIIIEENTGRE